MVCRNLSRPVVSPPLERAPGHRITPLFWKPGLPSRMYSVVRIFRLMLVVGTLLTLPVYGLAGIASTRSCQEQMHSAQQSSAAGDCCPGMADHGIPCKNFGGSPLTDKHGSCSACKAGFNCKTPQSYEPNHVMTLPATPVRSAISADPPVPLASHSLDGLWRPPA
jgi:hypothetical protein